VKSSAAALLKQQGRVERQLRESRSTRIILFPSFKGEAAVSGRAHVTDYAQTAGGKDGEL